MNPEILEKAQLWTTDDFDKKTQQEIQLLIDTENENELTDRFWKELEFGTGGLRGLRGAGINRMNIYNIRKVTQGLANYILAQAGGKKGVVIGRDSRINSLEFAQEAATVLVQNNINVYFFKDLCPTPIVSYAISKIGAKAGIMNTASHNPKEYNGYKVFWEDGAQLTSPHDLNVIQEIRKIDSLEKVRIGNFSDTEKSSFFHYCDELIDEYIQEAKHFTINPKICKSSDLKIIYSPLHGCGYKIAPKLLKKIGFDDVEVLESQSKPDGSFPSAPYPNPEEDEAMRLGLERAKETNADLFLATDPDADRIGVGYKTSKGTYETLNGNAIGFLIEDYLLSKAMPNKSCIISTIVSSPLIGVIAEEYDLIYSEVLTGFKWIAAEMERQISLGHSFLLGLEESHGYNISEKIKDKDGISASAIFAELTAFHKKQGKYLDQILLEIAMKFGYYKESQYSLDFPGVSGAEKMQDIMEFIRSNPPTEISECSLVRTVDYLNDQTGLPPANMVALFFDNNIRIIARPSGTEPKIKFYFSTHGEIACTNCMETVEANHAIIKKYFMDRILEKI